MHRNAGCKLFERFPRTVTAPHPTSTDTPEYVKPAPFKYHAPRTTIDALRLLADSGHACVLAGGQSLMPMLNFRLLAPEHVIDLNRVAALAGIRVEHNVLHVGAMTRQCDLEFSTVVRDAAPLLQAAVRQVGHRQTRNRGTVGGSLCHLDPAAELVTAAMALDATMVAESAEHGPRRIAIAAWGAGYLTNALRPGEILTAIEFSLWPDSHGYAFVEFARRKGDFAIAGVAALLAFDASGAITRAAVAIGGCGPFPQRSAAVEQALIGHQPSVELFKDAARRTAEIEAHSDAQVRADYRRHLARVLTERALTEAANRVKDACHGAPQ